MDESSPEHCIPQGESARSDNVTGTQEAVGTPIDGATPLIRNSSYEQQYDSKGYPVNNASRSLSRESRRAMNDVLATVGVCVGIGADGEKVTMNDRNKPSFDNTVVDSVRVENELGLMVDSIDIMLVSLSNMFTIGMRQRLQVCGAYSIPKLSLTRG